MNMNPIIDVLSPIDGDVLNERDGRMLGGCLLTSVRLSGPPDCEISVNGTKAVYMGGIYVADLQLKDYCNKIEIREERSGYRKEMTVYWLKKYTNMYRLSLDDNIWFLKDIAIHAHEYKSIFDNPYLGFYRKVHEKFGTKVHINIYYQTDDFNLSQMPSKYRSEWKENAHWLRLSFHALGDQPDEPYAFASYEEVKRDCEMVLEQIERFAGEDLSGPVTTLHWGAATVEGCRALRDAGYKCQVGDFNVDDDLSPVSYYLDLEKRRHIKRRFIWKDTKEDILFFRSSIIIDCHKRENIAPFLDAIWKDPHQSAYIDLLIHEQYFYPAYPNYQRDYKEKVLEAVGWAVEKGYKPGFLSECVFG